VAALLHRPSGARGMSSMGSSSRLGSFENHRHRDFHSCYSRLVACIQLPGILGSDTEVQAADDLYWTARRG